MQIRMTYTVLLVLAMSVLICSGENKLHFVIHMANLGARFPAIISGDWVKNSGGLTHVGMRQLYLLGRELRKRYIEDNELLDEQFKPAQFLLELLLIIAPLLACLLMPLLVDFIFLEQATH